MKRVRERTTFASTAIVPRSNGKVFNIQPDRIIDTAYKGTLMLRQTGLATLVALFAVIPQLSVALESSNPTADAVRMCVEECLAAYDTPSADLKKCVSSCSRLAELPTAEVELPLTPVPAQ